MRSAEVTTMNDRSLLGPWVRRFLLEHLIAERNLARNTQRSYRDALTLLIPFVAAKLSLVQFIQICKETNKRLCEGRRATGASDGVRPEFKYGGRIYPGCRTTARHKPRLNSP